ncbi:metalloregulator ArsR/SmtB family transcription factor [Aurantimonas sp. Leaf443]|uniref:ArsR/SmtB family transcription factor n=1 Tax=Aurantimonas sp. Leaf443 TaxID=1736378 RepID=UPI0006F8521A|nr:metalloregulator ArsR/SmtB family transcription factor [Aurantimonas sp. Leaf443]KQT83867.1 transcriptional regulator [Aurantimonas sp. Leaf443]
MDDLQEFEAKAAEVAAVLKAVANERRLMLLCKLLELGEANVGALAEAVGLSQSALSQHLTVLKDQGIVDYRRESQTLWYRICDPRIVALFSTLRGLFCPPKDAAPSAAPPLFQTEPREMSDE